MADTFFFYDLETSGFWPRSDRIMQFAGQRTDMELRTIGEPVNKLIKLTEDILPSPGAILLTGITPQQTIREGITEVEFLKFFNNQIAIDNTIFVGFNSIRFDDEFMRSIHYRNFYDPYEWQWRDNRSRWDLLDVARMTRALRPDGIKWPFDTGGKPANRLGDLAAANNIDHLQAHDAASDVKATIALARLFKTKQPKLFDYLLNIRSKQKIAGLVLSSEPFIYTSGKYSSDYQKTTVVVSLGKHPRRDGAIVYDLRFDPEPLEKLTAEQIADAWRWKNEKQDQETERLPLKTLRFNVCPAVAPLSILDEDVGGRIKLDLRQVQHNLTKLRSVTDLKDRIFKALDILERAQQTSLLDIQKDADDQLYAGFYNEEDRKNLKVFRQAKPEEFERLALSFRDKRLRQLVPLYKARNFPESLDVNEKKKWQQFIANKLLIGEDNGFERYYKQIEELQSYRKLNKSDKEIIDELKRWGEQVKSVAAGLAKQ